MAHGFVLFLLFSCIIPTNIHACKQTEHSSLRSFASILSSPPLNWTYTMKLLLLTLKLVKLLACWKNEDGIAPKKLLDFSSNLFNDDLAPGLWKCSELQKLHYPLNSLHGAFSDKIVNLTNLAILDLSFNHFGGKLTPNLGKLSKLKFVTLDFNNLEGSLPQSLMNCTNLVELRLGSNNLEGDISMPDFSRLTQLTKLDLRMNNFIGEPFINGEAVPYDPKSRNFDRRRENMQNRDFQNRGQPPTPNQAGQNPGCNMPGPANNVRTPNNMGPLPPNNNMSPNYSNVQQPNNWSGGQPNNWSGGQPNNNGNQIPPPPPNYNQMPPNNMGGWGAPGQYQDNYTPGRDDGGVPGANRY
ncbi:Hypothetical predicted protein [Prunus dulcis]|uniref:Uncharacterized protein n=1 Tax=Prunus dulcis TaxID=3755 RepID=A0A5E4ENT1_PRUDU|nr:Hypothetical predicted protein [Prunus dulcis]